MKKAEFKVGGMMCEGCERRVKNALVTYRGVKSVDASHTEGRVVVTGDELMNENELLDAIRELGFTAE